MVRMKGKSVEEAVNGALQVLGVSKDEADIKVLCEGEGGVLGVFGAKEAEVEVTKKMEPDEKAMKFLQEVLDRMELITHVTIETAQPGAINLDIRSDEISLIIGKEGHTIDAIQYITNIVANRGLENKVRVNVDAGGYRKKQEHKIEMIAKDAAAEAIASGRKVFLPPMNSKDRRTIHMTIKEMKNVESASEGEGINRRIVVTPAAK